MSLDVYLEGPPCAHCGRGGEVLHSGNITHNLNVMASVAGLYKPLWRPEELGLTMAGELVDLLTRGLAWLTDHPDEAKSHNPSNGWGDYDGLVRFTRAYLDACKANPTALVRVSR
jgi:hypothetical protein